MIIDKIYTDLKEQIIKNTGGYERTSYLIGLNAWYQDQLWNIAVYGKDIVESSFKTQLMSHDIIKEK